MAVSSLSSPACLRRLDDLCNLTSLDQGLESKIGQNSKLSMVYGDAALKLIAISRRSDQTDVLHPYDSTAIRGIALETRQLFDEFQTLLQSVGEEALRLPENRHVVARLTVLKLCMRRNKRCVLAYHSHRLDRLRDAYWQSGAALGHILGDDQDIRSRISPQEADFLRGYALLSTQYKDPFLDVMDPFSSQIEIPPKELHCNVRVLRDCGVIETESGSVDFRKGMRFRVVRSDVERLILQGYLELAP